MSDTGDHASGPRSEVSEPGGGRANRCSDVRPALTWPPEPGVSRTTVSFVLNGRADVKIPESTPATRVLDAADELGYHPHAPARQLAGGRSHIIALVLRQSAEQVAGDADPGRDAPRPRVGGPDRRLPGHGRATDARRSGGLRIRPCSGHSMPTASSSRVRASTTRLCSSWSATASRSSSRDRCRVSPSPASTSTTSPAPATRPNT